MNAGQLLAHFDRVADVPDAIPSLRRFFLSLAVCGKLVEQDPNDDPASRVLKSALSRADDTHNAGTDSDRPFEIPPSWLWISIGHAAHLEMGQSPPSEHYNQARQGMPFFQGKADFGSRHPTPRYWCSRPTKIARKDDVLISVRAPVGPTNVATEDCCIGRGLAALRPNEGVDRAYFLLCLNSFETALADIGYGTTFVAITKKQLTSFPIPIPPLAEQLRIAAKVDELMLICDRLEAAQAEREQRRDRLTAASLHRLNNGADAAAFREHARFTLDHLPRLTTRPDQIPLLRQTILNLAVRGKLVAQAASDEPVSELLKRIKEEKAQLAKEGKLRGYTTVTRLVTAQGPFQIPASWAWAPLGEVMVSRDGERIPVSKEERSSRAKVYDYYGASGIIDKIDGFLFDKPLLLVGEDGANLVNRSTPIAFIARGKYWVNNHAHVLDAISEDFLRFIELQINAIDLKPYVTGTAQPKMNQAKMNSIPTALPPEGEQHRIVAKVDELMELCDRLEAQLTTARTESGRLLEALLHEALVAAA